MKQKHILLINLGSPKSLDIKDVRSYLKEFLSDDLVIDLPKILQQIILRSFILPFRPRKTKEAYQTIWKNGSPLIENTRDIAKALHLKTGWDIDIAMRYQEPSIINAIQSLKKKQVTEVVIIPLYPHHAMSTTLSTEIAVKEIVNEYYPELHITFVKPFYDHPKYISALSKSIEPYLNNEIDKLIFSYHGIPERHIRKSDVNGDHCLHSADCCQIDCKSSKNCYRSNVWKTSVLTAKELRLDENQWMMSFQSRVSIIDPKWLKPYTDKELIRLPKDGVKNIAILCPSFVADCLETLEEINIRARNSFLDSGGESFTFIPCLNNDNNFIELLSDLINDI